MNHDGILSPLDVLCLVNFLNLFGSRPAAEVGASNGVGTGYYYNINGDAEVSPQDALSVINYLNQEASGDAVNGRYNTPAIPPAAGFYLATGTKSITVRNMPPIITSFSVPQFVAPLAPSR